MAKYTVELSEMLAGYAGEVRNDVNSRHIELRGHNGDSSNVKGKYNYHPYDDPYEMDFHHHEFSATASQPTRLIETYAPSFVRYHIAKVPADEYTSDEQLNTSITDDFFRAFVRHFYGYEIGQENPLYWWVLFEDWLNQVFPFWVQEYQQLIIKKQQWITNLQWAKQHGGQSGIAGTADTPQNELDFSINTGDPAKDYNFNFASQVDGNKAHSDSSSSTAGRNKTIAELTSELSTFANGLYIEIFEQAKANGLFMLVF